MKKRKGKNYFSKGRLKAIIDHLIRNTYFEVGKFLVCQSIGIPMGIDPAPFWANLYLYSYEKKFILFLIKNDKARARKFLNAMRTMNAILMMRKSLQSLLMKSIHHIYN